MKTAFSVF